MPDIIRLPVANPAKHIDVALIIGVPVAVACVQFEWSSAEREGSKIYTIRQFLYTLACGF